MDYTIETRKSFQVMGKFIPISAIEKDHSNLIVKFWTGYSQTKEFAMLNAWLPASGYEQADTPALEVYPLGDTTDSDYHCEAWVPITKI